MTPRVRSASAWRRRCERQAARGPICSTDVRRALQSQEQPSDEQFVETHARDLAAERRTRDARGRLL